MRSSADIEPEEFVLAWQGSKCLEEAALRLKLSPASASQRAHFFRSKGVDLKRFSRGQGRTGPQKQVDVAHLNRLVKETTT